MLIYNHFKKFLKVASVTLPSSGKNMALTQFLLRSHLSSTSLHSTHLLAQCTSLHSTHYPAQGTPPRTVHTPLHSTQHFSHVHVHGRRKDFFQGAPTRRFFQRFPGVEVKSGEISFFPLETKKTTIFKIQRGQGLPPPFQRPLPCIHKILCPFTNLNT